MAACVRAVLRSEAFGKSCAALQEASFRLGQASAYDFLKGKYPALPVEDPPLFPSEGLKEFLLQRFTDMVEQDFELLQFLASEGVDTAALKEKLGLNP